MVMTTPIATFEDILTALEQNPPWRAEMRRLVLEEEFLRLPDDVRELRQSISELAKVVREFVAATDARLDRLEAGQARLESDVTELKAGQVRLEAGQAELKAGQVRLEDRFDRLDKVIGRFGSLHGAEYEEKALQHFMEEMARTLGITQTTVAQRGTEGWDLLVRDRLEPAVRKGLIEHWQVLRLGAADGIVRFEYPDGSITCAVVEVSVSVNDDDRVRAAQRAEILHTVTGVDVSPFVVGQRQLERAPDVPDVQFMEFNY